MSNLIFPNLREIPFQAFSTLLSGYEFDTHHHSSLYDFGYLNLKKELADRSGINQLSETQLQKNAKGRTID